MWLTLLPQRLQLPMRLLLPTWECRTNTRRTYAAPALVDESDAPVPAVAHAAPAPVVECCAPAPVGALTPVENGTVPSPAVIKATSAPVDKDVASASRALRSAGSSS